MTSNPTNPDVADLLANAASDGVQADRAFHPSDSQSALRFVLNEIGAIMLGRRLTLVFDQNESLHLDVAGRRLLRVTLDDIPATLNANDDVAQSQLLTYLHERCASTRLIRASHTSLPKEALAAKPGISADTLSGLLGLKTTSRFAMAQRLLSPDCNVIASLKITADDLTPIAGSPEDQAALIDLGTSIRNDPTYQAELRAHLEQDGCLVLNGSQTLGTSVLITTTADMILVASLDNDQLHALLIN